MAEPLRGLGLDILFVSLLTVKETEVRGVDNLCFLYNVCFGSVADAHVNHRLTCDPLEEGNDSSLHFLLTVLKA